MQPAAALSRDVAGWLTLLPKTDGSRSTGLLPLKPSKFRSSAVVVTVNGVAFRQLHHG